jgi:hypothetical protein
MKSGKHVMADRSGAGKRRLRMPGFTGGAALDGVQQGYRSGPLRAVDDRACVIQPQFFRRLFRGIRPVARRAAPVVGRIARSVSRTPSLSVHCMGGLCRTVRSGIAPR